MKILFLTLSSSEGTLKGGELASKSNYDALVSIWGKENISIIKIPEEKNVIKKYLYYLLYGSMYSRHSEQKLVRQINSMEWDFIFFDGSWFGKISNLIKKKGKVVAFFHNIEHQYSLDRLKKNPLTLCKFLSVSYNESRLVREADYLITLNARDERLIEKYYGKKVDLILPIALPDKYEKYEKYEDNENGLFGEKTLLFLGSYFTPNIEGIKWFIKEVMPAVNYHLIIAGKGMEKLQRYENKKITVLGTVKDLSELYCKADIMVMPIFSGGGMKVKMAEAMMYGKRILATKEALTGYDICGIDAVTECNTKEEFIDALNGIKECESRFCPELRQRFLEKYEQSMKTQKFADFFTVITQNDDRLRNCENEVLGDSRR